MGWGLGCICGCVYMLVWVCGWAGGRVGGWVGGWVGMLPGNVIVSVNKKCIVTISSHQYFSLPFIFTFDF